MLGGRGSGSSGGTAPGPGISGLPRLTAAASIAAATASVAYTWARAAQTAAVSAPPPWPRYLTASAANSSALAAWVRNCHQSSSCRRAGGAVTLPISHAPRPRVRPHHQSG
jgi:hypothetical protein